MARTYTPSAAKRILIVGSGPNAIDARDWDLSNFDRIVAINNAWRVTEHWTDLIYPYDFPASRLPQTITTDQRLIDETIFVPAQNHYGGFVYAGGTMAFTTAYWVLKEYAPMEIFFIGCDMHYPKTGPTHFYGIGAPDPLREDISLTSLEGSSARFLCLASRQNCGVYNLSEAPSRLIFPRQTLNTINTAAQQPNINPKLVDYCLQTEQQLGYFVPDGRYWLEADRFSKTALNQLNKQWLEAAGQIRQQK
jgi:hypothetical protein